MGFTKREGFDMEDGTQMKKGLIRIK